MTAEPQINKLQGPNLSQVKLAKTLGLSYATVNRALNNKGKVKDETRARVLEAAERLGYHKNLVARSLVMQKTNIIGLVLCGTQNSFFGQIAGGIQTRASELDYHVLLADSKMDLNVETEAILSLLEVRAAGIIIQPAPDRMDLEIFHRLSQNNVPVLTINNRDEAVSRNFIGTDSQTGAMEAVDYLISLGHRRIAHFGGPQVESTGRERLQGYKRGMERAGLKIDPRWIVPNTTFHPDRERIADALRKLMVLNPRPTAIFAATDGIAMVAIQCLLASGFRVPEDISVMGYANMPECIYSAVPLTTMDQHPYEMGQRAIELLIDLIEGRRSPSCVEILKDTLVERSSCAKPSIVE
jgi:DNA-binding LacI/PurR family transcriptional regulator